MFTKGFEKVAVGYGKAALITGGAIAAGAGAGYLAAKHREKKRKELAKEQSKTAAISAGARNKLYKGLEYGGLGALTAIDAHDAYTKHKEGDKAGRNKALLGAGALTGLIAATKLAPH